MKRIIVIIVALVLCGAIALRLKSNHAKITAAKVVKVVNTEIAVNVSEVKKQSENKSLSLVGTLTPYKEINIAAEIQGKITSLNIELGQAKTKGSVIATIDDKQKRLTLQTNKVTLSKLKKDLERYENLFKGGTITEQQLDEMRTSCENAKIQVELAEKQLADASIEAPISGIITQKNIEQGSFANVGTTIATIVDISRLKVKLNVSEASVYQLKIGDKTTITSDIYPESKFEGKITFIAAKGDDTHNYPVEIEINNSGKNQLKAGTFVNVLITLPNITEGLYIPRAALLGSSKDAKVYVVQDGKVILKSIVVGKESDLFIEVISGISQGEKVVTTGQVNLENGKAVKIISGN